jgi:phospholipase C
VTHAFGLFDAQQGSLLVTEGTYALAMVKRRLRTFTFGVGDSEAKIMWRRRSLGGAPLPIVRMVLGGSNSRRLLRLGMFGLALAMTLLWARGSMGGPVSATSSSTSLGVVQTFGGALTTARSQLSVAPATATTGGDLLVLNVEMRRTASIVSVAGVSDTGGNLWFKATAVRRGNIEAEMWYAAGARRITPSGRVGVTATASAAIAITVLELSGITTSSALDVTATNSGSSASPSTGSTPRTNDASEIVVADIGWSTSVKLSGQTAGYTRLTTQQSKVSGEATGEQAAVRVVSATGTQRYAGTLSSRVPWTGVVATFEGSAAPPTPTPSPTPTATPTPTPTPPPGSPIKHVVVIYLENHSFDEVLGDWCLSSGRCDEGFNITQPVTLKGGLKVATKVSPDIVPNVNHSVASQVTAMDGGLMDGWAGVAGCGATSNLSGAIPYGCLTYYTPAQIPNLTDLASGFAISDETFSMADSPSWGGHLYAVSPTTDQFSGDNPVPPSPKPTGWTAGPGWGCDSNKVAQWINPTTGVSSMQPSCIPDPALGLPNGGAFEPTTAQYVPTIMDRLDQAGLSWRLYTAPSADSEYIWAVCPSFAECLDTTQAQNMVPTQQVLSDAAAGTLPSYSLVLGGAGTYANLVQHNQMSMAKGDNWIGQVVSAIENGPDWSSTAIFITYDDCGCFYDHVTPGVNPDGTQQGTRVPMVIVSPYARAGYTDSTPATFASILAYVEQTFGLASLGINDAGAYAFSNAFNYSQSPRAGIPVQHEAIPLSEQQYIAAHPPDPDDPT